MASNSQFSSPELTPLLRSALERSGRWLFLTGAGISAESGVPTFRGPEGYWRVGSRNYHPQELATRQAFEATPARHAPAVILALLPNVAEWAHSQVDGALAAAGTSAEKVGYGALASHGVVYHGMQLFGGGATLAGSGGSSSRNRTARCAISTRSPGASVASRTWRPFTRMPLRLSRSRTTRPAAVARNSA